MTFKVLEIRDEGTCIPVLAIRMKADNPVQSYYVHERSGYPEDGSSIMLMVLYNGEATNDPYEWDTSRLHMGGRTMPNAHHYVLEHFDELHDGDVIDVQFILGEAFTSKVSERLLPLRTPVDDGHHIPDFDGSL